MAHRILRGSPSGRLARLLTLFLVVALVIPGSAFAVVLSAYLFLPLPTALPQENPSVAGQISTVYDIDGEPIGEFRRAFRAIPIEAEQIPDTVRRAVVAVEDHEFFSHPGVNFRAVARALVANLTAGRIVQGGSTISQQLVKNLYIDDPDRSFLRKAREAILAAQLERELSKEEILARYLNTVYLGDSVFGVEAAARSYFRKPATELSLSEAALLAGLIPAPSRYSPRSHPEAAEERRQLVLDRLAQHGMASPQEIRAARSNAPHIHPPPRARGRYPYFLDYVRRYLEREAGIPPAQIFAGGLRIETTLDPALQERAIEVVRSTLPGPEEPDAALVAAEPRTGFVRALIGGKDWETQQVNVALPRSLIGRSGTGRQTGSAFKPFVLAQALDSGVSPSKVYAAPSCVSIGDWRPCNYGGSGYGSASVRRATQSSINTVFAQLIMDVGVRGTAKLAGRMGVEIDPDSDRVDPTISLGTWEASPLEMASGFSVFAARGVRAEPTPVLRVTDRSGNVLVDNTEPESRRVLREVVADTVNDILQGVIAGGTARRADIGRPAAGKTGTTSDSADAWFVGYTPTLSTAVWMGHAEGRTSMPGAVGGGTPARMWAAFMDEALANVPETDFNEPAPLDSLQERALVEQRGGFDIGSRRWPAGASSGSYHEPPPEPRAGPPPTAEPTTTTSSTTSTTTTTTTPGGFLPPGSSTSSTSSSTTTTTTTEPDDDDEGPF